MIGDSRFTNTNWHKILSGDRGQAVQWSSVKKWLQVHRTHPLTSVTQFPFPPKSAHHRPHIPVGQMRAMEEKNHRSRKVLFPFFFLLHFQSTVRDVDKENSILRYIVYLYLWSHFSVTAVSLLVLPQSIHYQSIPEKTVLHRIPFPQPIPINLYPFPCSAFSVTSLSSHSFIF